MHPVGAQQEVTLKSKPAEGLFAFEPRDSCVFRMVLHKSMS